MYTLTGLTASKIQPVQLEVVSSDPALSDSVGNGIFPTRPQRHNSGLIGTMDA